MIFEKVIKWSVLNPRKLLLIDGLGALLSAILLSVVLVEMERFFGIPKPMLYILALFPCLFAVYDFYCYQYKTTDVKRCLKGIGFMNLFYCIVSVGLAIIHVDKLTYFGWIYIGFEILIVVTLASLELKVAKRHIPQSQISDFEK